MGYRLESRQPVADDVRRIAAHQLELAIARLTCAGDARQDGSIHAECDAVDEWHMSERGFRAISGGLARTARASRRAMAKAAASARVGDYREWRQRAKYHWLQTRLLKTGCGNGLALDQRRLEALDGYLGDCHNCAVLRDVLTSDSLLHRTDAARGLRMVRRYERELRRCARRVGKAIYREAPKDFVRRVRCLWRSTQHTHGTRHRETPWRSAA